MHGLVHLALRAFVADDAAWQSVLREAGVVNEDAILDAVQYADATTLALFRATAAERNLDPSAALGALGEHFVDWLAEMGHMRMLDALGTTLDDVLRNVNTLHHNFWRTHRGAHFPILKVDGRSADGTLVISCVAAGGRARARASIATRLHLSSTLLASTAAPGTRRVAARRSPRSPPALCAPLRGSRRVRSSRCAG